jgi:hypothetical protein
MVLLHNGVVLFCIFAFAAPGEATPVMSSIEGFVETVGSEGLVPADRVPVNVCLCRNLPSCLDTCSEYFNASATSTAGLFRTTVIFTPPGLVAAAAKIGDVVLRGFVLATGHSIHIAIDPISEAASRLIETGEYSIDQGVLVLTLVRSANAATEFGGLSLNDAVERARSVALADPAVLASLTAWTPTRTPTATNTPTSTPTRTLHPTGTPRICVGDCNLDGHVDVDEVIVGVSLILGALPGDTCSTGYRSSLDVADLVTAIDNALNRCDSLDPLPDLLPFGLEFVDPALTCSNPFVSPSLCLRICVANVGDLDASPFDVSIDGGGHPQTWSVNGLLAGDGACQLACDTGYDGLVRVDVSEEVSESREDNNILPFRTATPTPPPTCPSPTPT